MYRSGQQSQETVRDTRASHPDPSQLRSSPPTQRMLKTPSMASMPVERIRLFPDEPPGNRQEDLPRPSQSVTTMKTQDLKPSQSVTSFRQNDLDIEDFLNPY